MFQRGEIAEGAAAAIMILLALALVLVPYTLWVVVPARAGEPPWLTWRSPTRRSIGARRSSRPAPASARPRRHLCGAGRLRGHLPAAAARGRAELVPRTAGDRAQRAHRLAAQLLRPCLGRGLEQLLRRRHLRRHEGQLPQFAEDDDPGHDHLDDARGRERLRAHQMALPGQRIAVRLPCCSASSCRARSR